MAWLMHLLSSLQLVDRYLESNVVMFTGIGFIIIVLKLIGKDGDSVTDG